MRKTIKEVFLGVRFLVSLYFLFLSLGKGIPSKDTVVILTALYFSFALLTYLKSEQTGWMNKFMDVPFVPSITFLSGEGGALLSLFPLMVVHTNRNPLTVALLFLLSTALTLHSFADNPLLLFSTLALMSSAPLSAFAPDLLGTIRRERDSVNELRKAYRKLLQDFARWERERKELEHLKFLMEVSVRSGDVRDFLGSVKDRFRVKKIHLVSKRQVENYAPLVDREKGLLLVPVKLEDGNAVVIFEMENPFQLNDDLLVSSLERAGRMVSLFVAGFEESSSLGRVINID